MLRRMTRMRSATAWISAISELIIRIAAPDLASSSIV